MVISSGTVPGFRPPTGVSAAAVTATVILLHPHVRSLALETTKKKYRYILYTAAKYMNDFEC
jgi:hypothetical protein